MATDSVDCEALKLRIEQSSGDSMIQQALQFQYDSNCGKVISTEYFSRTIFVCFRVGEKCPRKNASVKKAHMRLVEELILITAMFFHISSMTRASLWSASCPYMSAFVKSAAVLVMARRFALLLHLGHWRHVHIADCVIEIFH